MALNLVVCLHPRLSPNTWSVAGTARGIVFGSYGLGQPGHVFNVVNQNGVVRYLDGQTGKPANMSNFKTLQLLRTN
ncbi:toxin glutamine deamidase domain-containing protein [Pseudomonas morbosilactucae]|jgi:hypothetical protein|uniref:toxin glutamine deamidase domain-containing protein n=1 Tax=Pseudomonas morbosilactucae TaxID=2938197 RepID=UPI003CC60755